MRNAFLAGAFELRSGIPEGSTPKGTGPDVIQAICTGLFLDFLGIRMDSTRAEDFEFAINRTDLERTMMGGKTFMAQLEDATATYEGDPGVLQELGSTMIDFDLFFEVVPGTRAPTTAPDLNDFEVGPVPNVHE